MQSQRIDWLYYLPEVVLYLDYKIPPATTAVIPSLITAWFQGRQICSISQLFTHSQKCTFMHLDLVVLSQWPSVLLQPSSSWIMHENWAVNDREKEQFWIWHNLFIAFRFAPIFIKNAIISNQISFNEVPKMSPKSPSKVEKKHERWDFWEKVTNFGHLHMIFKLGEFSKNCTVFENYF